MALLFIFASSLLYFSFGYDLARTDISKFLTLYIALFACAYQIIKLGGFNFKLMVVAAVLFRLVFLFAIPNLSQDFYRFIWDGRMILEGINPYLYTPDSFIQNGKFPIAQSQELYNGMGELSASHYTNYPPLNQLFFVLGNLFPGKSILSSVIGMRLIIIAADIGTLYFGKKLLERLKIPSKRIFWYILNPFIIIELTGNLHFEGIMIFFLIWSLYLLHSGKWKRAALVLACSISVKLIPLMFLPIFFWWFVSTRCGSIRLQSSTNVELPILSDQNHNIFQKKGLIKLIQFYIIIIVTILLLFIPFFSMEFLNNYSKTVGLWFGNFEFNASIYYLIREIGYTVTGYNQIAVIGKILPVISLIIILLFSFLKNNNTIPKLTTSILLTFTFYLLLSTTVHPWYIATLVILCIFTNYRFPLVWSLVIVLSYLAYSNNSNSENLWIIALEYLVVYAFIFWEIFLKKKSIKKANYN
ncbi:mannosyltransferase [Winogradskyella ursingii]|uniref:mannosyltransferase n=1 Tax=Winogradskyella ursingii TaxID=2686079 RepID=UPI001FE77451|nr:mannosyltransferase [Winogradskyella ursingii]